MIGFAEFLEAAHKQRPYPWQVRLAERCASAEPPAWIVAPTGAGKTTTVDALVWALAMQAERPAGERTASLRTVWAIDRRILVDQVYERSCQLASRLDAACDDQDDPLYEVAHRLLILAACGEDVSRLSKEERDRYDLSPLAVVRWRGGLSERATLLSPCQPQVITSTVGQIGSRLLFRGYGVAEGSLAVNAGFAACDTAICLDEAHLAEPFRQTVAEVRRRRSLEREQIELPELRIVTLTATPPRHGGDAVVLDAEDHARLGRRWTGEKALELRESAGRVDAQFAAAAQELLDRGHSTVACVLNSVALARLVERRLSANVGESADVMLLIGPQRPADRAVHICKHGGVLFEGATPDRPLVVVATQTFEVGLDADVTAMVTQSASASALVQRLGRLNRSGNHRGEAIVVRDDSSPLYGEDEPDAWTWLLSRRNEAGTVDVSVRAVSTDAERPSDRRAAVAATLTDRIVAQLAQTSPRPAPYADPDVEVLLRGVDERPASDVALVWRCDLRLEQEGDEARAYRTSLLRLAPPQPHEMLTLSLRAAKAVLAARLRGQSAGKGVLQGPDVEGGEPGSEVAGDAVAAGDSPAFLVRRGREILHGSAAAGPETVALARLRPGDVIVIPSGEVDPLGLTPASERIRDVGADLQAVDDAERPMPVRLNREVWGAHLWKSVPFWVRSLERDQRDTVSGDLVFARFGLSTVSEDGPGPLRALRQQLMRGGGDWAWRVRRVDPWREDVVELDDALLTAQLQEAAAHLGEAATDARSEMAVIRDAAWVLVPVRRRRSEREDAAARERPPVLEEHAGAVAARARLYATAIGLPARVRTALDLAARAHDHGKADTRIQDHFAGGIRAVGSPPLAKSVHGTEDPRADRRARALAGMPRGLRHEVASVAVLAKALASGGVAPEFGDADFELALHLVGAHHGRGRPIPPVPAEAGAPAEPFSVDLCGVRGTALGDGLDGWADGSWFERFFALHARYGPWSLAFLEGLLVLADRTVSREGG